MSASLFTTRDFCGLARYANSDGVLFSLSPENIVIELELVLDALTKRSEEVLKKSDDTEELWVLKRNPTSSRSRPENRVRGARRN